MKESIIFSEQNLTEIVHYVYRVTIDEKYYIGKRTGRLDDLRTGAYTTSSKLVHEKLKNGITFSKIKILKIFSSSKDALEFENRILTRLNASTNPKFLNQYNGGGGNYTLKQHTEKSKKKMSKSQKTRFDINTEEGRKSRENKSQSTKAQFNPNTEQGRKNIENHSKIMKEKAKEQLQNRKNNSILGELMFNEEFIKENFLIRDDKNNLRFLWSVYSKLTGFCRSHIRKQKRIGKLIFLRGINSISITKELENSKIKEIEAIIKSRNNEKE